MHESQAASSVAQTPPAEEGHAEAMQASREAKSDCAAVVPSPSQVSGQAVSVVEQALRQARMSLQLNTCDVVEPICVPTVIPFGVATAV